MKFTDNSRFRTVTHNVTHKTMPLLASYGLPVAGVYRIETHALDSQKVRVAVADWNVPERGDCWPVLEPRLAEDFARVSDERSLQEFNGRYGLLGYHRLHEAAMLHRKETWQGDPVPWALAHAAVAAGILEAVNAINDVRSGKVKLNDQTVPSLLRALFNHFGKMGLEAVFEGEPRRFTGFVWRRPEALVGHGELPLRNRSSSSWGNDPIGTSYRVLSWVLNQYIRFIHFEFVSLDYAARFFGLTQSEPRFGPEFRWEALLQVIYWQLAERVGGAFRQCQRCGRIFPMRTGKDKFCSPQCGSAMRSQRYRDKPETRRKKRSKRSKKKWQKRRKRK